MNIVQQLYCCTFQQRLCKLPDEGNCAEMCRSKLTVKYIIQGDTKKRERLKTPTKIEEIQEKKNY